MLRRRAGVLVIAMLAALSGVATVAPLRVSATTYTLTLTASTTTASAGQTVVLTATASSTPPPDYFIDIYDQASGDDVVPCTDQNPCSGPVSYPTSSSHTYKAELTDGFGNLLATSNPVTVTWVGTATYTITLSASSTQAQGGQPVTLTATASPGVPTGYFIDVFEVGTQNDQPSCFETNPCSGDVTYNSGQHSFTAYLDNDTNVENPPTGTLAASSPPTTVTWVPPSEQYCDPPTLPILGGSVAGFNTLLAARTGTDQTAVCFRADNGGSLAVGGAVLVTSGAPTLPTVLPSNQCQTAVGNTLPGPHPLINETVLGASVYLDVYSGPSSGNAVWVCASVGATSETAVIPTTGQLPSVTFVPDPDSILQGLSTTSAR